MPFFERNYNDLLQESLTEVVNTTRLTRVSVGAKVRALLEATNRNLNEAYRTFDRNLARAFLSGATGKYLDFVGEMLGASRAGLETARVHAADRTIRFYVDVGNFGGINGGESIVLPPGTIISSDEDATGVTYRTITPAVLASSVSEAFVSAEAVIPGSSSNIGSGVLRFHDFTGYDDSENNSLLVENVSGIFTGAETELDQNYRYRISQQTLASEMANETAIRTATLLVPGVADLLILRYFRGIGSYRVLIKSITPTVPASLITAVQSIIESVTAQGIIAEAARPLESGMSFSLTLRFRKRLPQSERDLITSAVRTSLKDYVNGLDIAEEFVVNEAVERVMSVSEDIKDIGIPTKPFDEIFLHRQSALEDNRVREEAFGNIEPQSFERLIIEPSVSVPIRISETF